MIRKKWFAALSVIPVAAFAALPFTFQPGQTISAAEINANFKYLESRIETLSAAQGGASPQLQTVVGVAERDVTMLSNTGPYHLEIVQVVHPGGYARALQCADSNSLGGMEIRFIPPNCRLVLYLSGSGGMGTGAFIVTYRPV